MIGIEIVLTVNKSIVCTICAYLLYVQVIFFIIKKINLKKTPEMYIDNSLNNLVVQPYKIAGLPGYRALII